MTLSGRIAAEPARVWHDEVLAPQFRYELTHLLPWYLAIEKVLLLEYVRMGLASLDQAGPLAARLSEIGANGLNPDPAENMSDIAFAVERYVATGPVPPFPAWHVDRSRNDLQACAQLLWAREELIRSAQALHALGMTAIGLARRSAAIPMPGYTHLQAAQVITPGFYFAAMSEEILRTLRRLDFSFSELDRCPLGAGAMAGQELDWDTARMARLLGFSGPAPHALVAVASRGWALSVAGDLSAFGVTLSRFVTDLMMWGSGEYGYIDLPDELSGISSAMPQKKNFPILERVRGRSAHLASVAMDVALAQRSTPYSNMVEVSKESCAHLWQLFEALRSATTLLTTVLDNLTLRADRMRAACEREYLGGFTLANLLTTRAGIPWRSAQVLAGRYVVAATERGLPPTAPDGDLLAELAAAAGHQVAEPSRLLAEAFDVTKALGVKRSPGSTSLRAVLDLLTAQEAEYKASAARWDARAATTRDATAAIDDAFRPGSGAAWTDERSVRGRKTAPQAARPPGGSGGPGRGAAWTDERSVRGRKAAPQAARPPGGSGGSSPRDNTARPG
jgi:argininosuccinate lyase